VLRKMISVFKTVLRIKKFFRIPKEGCLNRITLDT
jgi:hypothetical protein